ncbi:hypothetical protein PUG42_19690 [Erwiniaceae bacterium L1_54_3]|nr:hypothetical protein [Erwiniaceae bacterium L1_54_3]
MQEFKLPQLPDGYRWGAEGSYPLTNPFNAPDGTVIKKIDTENGFAICVPFQMFHEPTGTWLTISTQS